LEFLKIKMLLKNFNKINLPHPIQYQGSKRALAPIILSYFPNDIDRLIEPFAGTAAISVASAHQNLAKKYWLNDLNKPLIKLLELIIEQPEEIANFYEKIWWKQEQDSIGHYYAVREKFNQTDDPKCFLYLLSRCAKGSVRYNREGYFNQSPDKRRKGTKPQTMKKNILGVSYLLKDKTHFSCRDYKDMLANISTHDLIYMDPPYQGVCKDKDARYYASINFNEFVETLGKLNAQKLSFIISYDGKTGDKIYGKKLPPSLKLTHFEIEVGSSSQATLLGKREITYESLYLSQALINRLNHNNLYTSSYYHKKQQLSLGF